MSFIKRGSMETWKNDIQTDNNLSGSEKITLIPLVEDETFLILVKFLYNYICILA